MVLQILVKAWLHGSSRFQSSKEGKSESSPLILTEKIQIGIVSYISAQFIVFESLSPELAD